MRSCLASIERRCLRNHPTIKENDKALTKEFMLKMQTPMFKFLQTAIILSTCLGFVPFYVKRVTSQANSDKTKNSKPDNSESSKKVPSENGPRSTEYEGLNIPVCLPLGTFAWHVENQSIKSRNKPMPEFHGLLRYAVQPCDGLLDASDVYVFPVSDPVMTKSRIPVFCPLYGVLREYSQMLQAQRKRSESNQWNSSKHVVITEEVNLKDQTTSGLQLLDEQRRYQLTGQHNGVTHNHLLRLQNREGGNIKTVNDGLFYAVRSEFADNSDTFAPSSKRACCHVMPPNVKLQELGELACPPTVEIEQPFVNAVYTFFNSKAGFDLTGSGRGSVAEANVVSQEEQESIQNIIFILQKIAATAYARCYKIPIHTVQVEIKKQSKLDSSSASDVKAYADAEVLGGLDKLGLKRKLTDSSVPS